MRCFSCDWISCRDTKIEEKGTAGFGAAPAAPAPLPLPAPDPPPAMLLARREEECGEVTEELDTAEAEEEDFFLLLRTSGRRCAFKGTFVTRGTRCDPLAAEFGLVAPLDAAERPCAAALSREEEGNGSVFAPWNAPMRPDV